MKKLVVFLASSTSLMLAIGGLVLVGTAQTASAAYPGTVATTCHVKWTKKAISRTKKAKVRFSATAAGTARPTGTVKIVAKTRSGSHRYVRKYTYIGDDVRHPFRKMKRGRYVVKMKYTPPTGSVFTSCRATGPRKLRVR